MSKEIGEKLVNRCNLTPRWWGPMSDRNLDRRPQVGPALAQCESSLQMSQCRERMPDTMRQCQSTERLSVEHVSEYSETYCNFSILKLTNKPAGISTVLHRSSKVVEPRSNSILGSKWKYKTGQQGLVDGFYWQYDSDGAGLVNSPGISRIARATRHGHYKAIEITEGSEDKHTRQYQEAQRNSSPIDNWLRRDTEFVRDNLLLWSKYLSKHDNSAESIVTRPDQLPSSDAYKRCTRQRLARPI